MLKPGDSFERYTIEAPIGSGGMGSVYRALDTRLGRRVALKVLADRVTGPHATARLVREARAAAALDHPNAVAIFDTGDVDGTPYIVMELVDGQTLRQVIGDAAVSQATRVAQLADVGRALGAAHKRGLVHRDVKPENVMIREDGMVKVLDFGIARRAHGDVDPAGPTQTPAISTLTIDGLKLGTPVYMAPEQIRGDQLDGRADQFSWGVVAYELLTGKLPWRGNDALAAMASALTEPARRDALDEAGVSRGVQDVVLRALAKRPEERFASMEEAVAALVAAGRGEAAAPDPPPGATAAQRFSTGEVREVLARAVERQAEKDGGTKLAFDDLLAIAAEVGVDPESLREASRALRAPRERGASGGADGSGAPKGEQAIERAGAPSGEIAAKRAAWLRRRRRDFNRHLAVFVICNAALLVLGLVLLSFTPWWIWPIPGLLWAVGLAIHGFVALTSSEDDWDEENERMQWWNEERRRRHEERMAALGRGAPPPRRIEARRLEEPRPRIAGGRGVGQEQEKERLRLASDTGSDRAAEAEEEAAEAERRAGRRRQR